MQHHYKSNQNNIMIQDTRLHQDIKDTRLHQDIKDTMLNELSNFSFSSKNLISFTKHTKNTNKNLKKEETNAKSNKECKQTRDNLFDPFLTQKDSLFWCFYVLVFGLDKYEMLGNQHFVEEKKIKFQYIELFRSKKDILKMHKIKPLSELEDDLANKEAIGIKTFIALCIIANVNVMMIDNRKYYETINNDTLPIYIIHHHKQPLKFVMELESPLDKIEYYRNHFFKLPTFDWTIKSISSYKTDELHVLCEKLGIESNESESNKNNKNNKKITKKDLYEQIILHFYKQ
jgi:hypothetical protein